MSLEQSLEQPSWLLDGNKVNEVKFCDEFTERYPMKYIDNRFINVDGTVPIEKVSTLVSDMLIPYVVTGIARRVKSIVDFLKLYCHAEKLNVCSDEIHVLNGVLKISGRFIERKDFCPHRMNVRYTPNQTEPYVFLKFLREMLDDEDILTLQEYLGYCLIPSTKGQAMMFIIGNGGEGKSRIGVVMKAIFGEAMIESQLHRLESDRFSRANLQNKLLMIDDDMQLEALSSTGYLKTLVTAETPVDVEVKGQQSYQATLYARFLCFSNGSPKTLYDRTEGFSRRLIILTTKPVPKDRKVDRYIAERMIEEKDKIFNWMFAGLQRLIQNQFRFTISEKSKRNISDMMTDNCNIIDFLQDENAVFFGADKQISSMSLCEAYSNWCDVNALTPLKRDSFLNWLKTNQAKYNIRYDCNVKSAGRRVRGFIGIYATPMPCPA